MGFSKTTSRGLLYPFRHGLYFSFFEGSVWLIATATPMVLLLQELHASPFQVSLAYAFTFLMYPLQVLGTIFLKRHGYKRQVVLTWILRSFCLVVPLLFAIMRPAEVHGWMASVMVASVFLFCLFRALGHSALYPWLYALVPRRNYGLYFSFDQILMYAAGLCALFFSAYLFNYLSLYNGFLLVYFIAVVSSVAAIVALKKLKTVEHTEALNFKFLKKDTIRLCFTPGPFRFYLVLSIIWFIFGTPYLPFTIYYMKAIVLVPDSQILFYTGVMYVGAIMSAFLARKVMDRVGVMPFFVLSLTMSVAVKFYWLFVSFGQTSLLGGLIVVFFINGLISVMWQVAHLKYAPMLCSKKDRALGVAIQTAVVGFIGGATAIGWGYLLSDKDNYGSLSQSMLSFYFLASVIGMGAIIVPFMFIKEERLNEENLTYSKWIPNFMDKLRESRHN